MGCSHHHLVKNVCAGVCLYCDQADWVAIFLNQTLCECVYVCVHTHVCESMCKYVCAQMGQEAALSRMDLLLKFEQF